MRERTHTLINKDTKTHFIVISPWGDRHFAHPGQILNITFSSDNDVEFILAYNSVDHYTTNIIVSSNDIDSCHYRTETKFLDNDNV
jgi:hypothetical protein